MLFGIIVLTFLVGLIVYGSTRPAVRSELEVILGDLSETVEQLETFAESKGLEIADHLEEVALHQKHVSIKGAEVDRANRIRSKLAELLA